MHNTSTLHLLALIFLGYCITMPLTILGKFSLKKVYALFETQPYEQIMQKKYQLNQSGTLIIENLHGNIEVTTEWGENTIFLKAVKQSSNPAHLEYIHVQEKSSDNNILTICTRYDEQTIKGSVDYQLIVPANLKLILSTGNGSITIKESRGPITATTTSGSIEIYNTKSNINARTRKTGDIVIHQATGTIHATTNYGKVTIKDAKNSIIASTQKGKINIDCIEVPQTSTTQLNTVTGNITLALPVRANANIQGKTDYGLLTSDLYVTIKPQTTRLNNLAWTKFKKEVDGFIGTGDADIRLNSMYGNIKIVENVA